MMAIISHIQENTMDTNLKMSLCSTLVALVVIIVFSFTAVLN
ncbi:YnhF family membrane protein [Dickeya zeae]|uniref:YnhF family membrane protein n=2 Tax=Dickeya TaxID=204037 RepID=A0AAE7CZ03_9GAMM|nr:YnhF family membrane protein [Dickeya zeae]QIZ50855.1 YnhF family membrane protein [Dickeya zeae]QYM90649.1 YnhF family membrane protein [Dickeya zeae]